MKTLSESIYNFKQTNGKANKIYSKVEISKHLHT